MSYECEIYTFEDLYQKMWNINNFYVVTFWNDIFDISVQLKYIKIILLGTSLGVHWLRHYASNAGDTDLISAVETKIPTCCLAKKKEAIECWYHYNKYIFLKIVTFLMC